MIEITNLQLLWLRSRADRTINDVVIHNGNPCVVMRWHREDTFVPIPNDKQISREYYAGIRTYDRTRAGISLILRKRPLY